jgi:hypothetical protein
MPEISVIITTRNRPSTLIRAIESARAASQREVEIVVVDDASTDETAGLCRSVKGINYIRVEHNQGVAGARNLGILSSRGAFLSFLDDDDVRLPGSLDHQLKALVSAPDAGLIYGQAILGYQDGTPSSALYPARCPGGEVFWQLLAQNFMPCGATLFRRSCLYRVGLLDDGISGIDDWDLWIRIAELYPVLAQEQPVMIWRQSTPVSGQGSSNAIKIVRQCTRQFRECWMSLPRAAKSAAPERLKSYRTFSSTMARHLLREAVRSAAVGRLFRSQKNILAAFCLYPKAVAEEILRPDGFNLLLTRAQKVWRSAKDNSRRPAATAVVNRL